MAYIITMANNTVNKHSYVGTTETDDSNITRTERRDEGTFVASLVEDKRTGAKRLRLGRGSKAISLNGRELRTLLMVIDRHYETFE